MSDGQTTKTKRAAVTRRKPATRGAKSKVTEVPVLVRVDIEERGVGNIARYSGLFFVFVGAFLSLVSMSGLYAESERSLARVQYEENERTFALFIAQNMRASVQSSFEAGSATVDDEIAVAPDDTATGTPATSTPVAATVPMPTIPYTAMSAAVPQFISNNIVALVSSLTIAMLGLVLLLISMYVIRRHAPLSAAPKKRIPSAS